MEDWAEHLFLELIFNLANPREKKDIYASVGLEWTWVLKETEKHFDIDETVRDEMKRPNNIFRVLVKTLLNAHIITDRTKSAYAEFVDMEELKDEGDEFKPAEEIAELGMKHLEKINKAA